MKPAPAFKHPYFSHSPNGSAQDEGVAEDGEAGVPVDEKENGIGGAAADSPPVALGATLAGAREGWGGDEEEP